MGMSLQQVSRSSPLLHFESFDETIAVAVAELSNRAKPGGLERSNGRLDLAGIGSATERSPSVRSECPFRAR